MDTSDIKLYLFPSRKHYKRDAHCHQHHCRTKHTPSSWFADWMAPGGGGVWSLLLKGRGESFSLSMIRICVCWSNGDGSVAGLAAGSVATAGPVTRHLRGFLSNAHPILAVADWNGQLKLILECFGGAMNGRLCTLHCCVVDLPRANQVFAL